MKSTVIDKIFTHLFLSSVILLITFCWLYYPVIFKMVSEWYNNPNHSHGFIIPLISGYFVWQRKEIVKRVAIRPTNWGIFLLISGLLIYVLGNLGAAYTTTRVSMFIVLAGIILFIYGKELFRNLYFPFFYLLLMIPVPPYIYDTVAFPLKLFVTKYSVLFMKLIGISVLREGNVIMLENITLQVVDACSGIRSLTALFAIGIAFAYLTQKSNFKKIFLVCATIPVAIIANSIRVIITGILSKYYGGNAAEGFFHEFAGLGVFMLSVMLLIVIGILLNKTGKSSKF